MDSPLILRLFTASSAFCFAVSAVTNFILSFRYLGYTATIVNLIAFFFSIVALVCEFSPYGLNVIMAQVPCLGDPRTSSTQTSRHESTDIEALCTFVLGSSLSDEKCDGLARFLAF
eukprot:GHVS01028067.1.p1 GENE.GHVS01028067.1~~GHVS01028067.1.p1  ORF type:complete len:116 (+),score=8.23 GHVS01028067.1:221-568(+)